MADKEEKKQEQKEEKEEQQPQDEPKPQDESKKSSSLGLFTWLIMAAVVIAGLVGGFALAQLVAGTQSDQLSNAENADDENSLENKAIKEMLVEIPADAKLWNYDLEPVVANLDEPGVTRYARITVTMQLSPQMNQEKETGSQLTSPA